MKPAEWLNGGLWIINVLLGAWIVVFAFQYLLFPAETDHLKGMAWVDLQGLTRTEQPKRVDVTSLRTLENPVVPPVSGGGARGVVAKPVKGVTLKGTFAGSDPKQGVAFLEIASRRKQVTAYCGKPVKDGDALVPEMQGWTLKEVYRDRAVFHADGRPPMILEVEGRSIKEFVGQGGRRKGGTGPARPPTPKAGGPYNASSYPQSKVIQKGPNHQVWNIEKGEVEYATGNMENILEKDVTLSTYPDGGIKLDQVREGSIAALRGLSAGDVIKSVNGIPVNNVAEVQKLLNSDRIRKQGRLRVVVQRAGRAVTFEYRMGRR
ncbi:MAG: PDZ domain-containing protein [Planctomycetota bacterium]|jgi:membrane-associated protease RseP (regulator of RpoE activity)